MKEISIEEMLRVANQEGFRGINAEAKVCQDLILKAISASPFSQNATIKGGVVMRSLSGSARRATLDIDVDFIRYSISDGSVDAFIESFNSLPGVSFSRVGPIEELKQQDYRGKRAYVRVCDASGRAIQSKVDFGVHKELDIAQTDYCFEVSCYDGKASLLINSKEQMVAEKTKSLLRFGSRSTRFKDVFDIYYLLPRCKIVFLRRCFQKYVFDDLNMKEKTFADVAGRLNATFSDGMYLSRLKGANKNWVGDSIENVLRFITEFISKL